MIYKFVVLMNRLAKRFFTSLFYFQFDIYNNTKIITIEKEKLNENELLEKN